MLEQERAERQPDRTDDDFNPDALEYALNKILSKKYSRWEALGLGWKGMAALGALEVSRKAAPMEKGLIGEVYDYIDTWWDASVSNEKFIEKNRDDLVELTPGASFAAEKWWESDKSPEKPLEGLRYTVEELGFKKIRLGARWNKIVDDPGSFDFSFYKPYLDYCLDNNVDVCLNVGPIKTFRYPEEHVPPKVLLKIGEVPQFGMRIRSDSKLAEEAFKYTRQLGSYLKSEYSTEKLKKICAIQPENEYMVRFGKHEWTIDEEYMKKQIMYWGKKFPDSKVLLNSGGRQNIEANADLFAKIEKEEPTLAGRFISGVDYYYRMPKKYGIEKVPLLRDVLAHVDSVMYQYGAKMSYRENIERSIEQGYRIEVTEGQMEKFGRFKSPGKSVKHLMFLLLRSKRRILNMGNDPTVMLWGLEEFSQNRADGEFSPEQVKMAKLLKDINGLQPAHPNFA